MVVWFGLVGFLTSSSTTRLYRRRAPRQSVWQFYVLPHMRQSWDATTSVTTGHIILTPTQPVGSGRPQRELNPEPTHQESRALPTKLPRPPSSMVIHIHNCTETEVTEAWDAIIKVIFSNSLPASFIIINHIIQWTTISWCYWRAKINTNTSKDQLIRLKMSR